MIGYPLLHNSDVKWVAWCLKSPTTQLSVQRLAQAGNNKNVRASHYWPFVRGIHRWFHCDSEHEGPVMRMFRACGKLFRTNAKNAFHPLVYPTIKRVVTTWGPSQYKDVVLPHDDVIKWKHFPRNWPFVRGIYLSPVNSPHKGQWRGALVFPLICVWINGWVNNREAGDLRRNRAHYDVTVMSIGIPMLKIGRSHERLIFNMGISIPGKDGLYIETGHWLSRKGTRKVIPAMTARHTHLVRPCELIPTQRCYCMS